MEARFWPAESTSLLVALRAAETETEAAAAAVVDDDVVVADARRVPLLVDRSESEQEEMGDDEDVMADAEELEQGDEGDRRR